MKRLATSASAVATGMLLFAAPAFAEINGTYRGETDDGQTVTVNIAGNKLASVSSIVVRELSCERVENGITTSDGTEAAAFPVNTAPRDDASLDTIGTEVVGGNFSFGDAPRETELAQGDTFSSGDVNISTNGSSLSYLFTFVTNRTPASPADGPATSRRTCTGGGSLELTLQRAPDTRKSARLDAPRGIKDPKALIPPLTQIGEEGLTVTYASAKKDGKLLVDVHLAKGSDDPFRIGDKSLGNGGAKTKQGTRGKVKVPIKSTLGPPDEDDVVKLEITLTYKADGVKGRSTQTVVRVPA